MDLNNIIVLAIIATSVATFISRFLGAVTSERVDANSKLFDWFNLVAYSTLAALLSRIIIFPAGVLADAELIVRLLVLVCCIFIFIIMKKNLVIPTIFSAILLSVLTSI
jgi:branched-subunit amino acid transport protein